MSHWNINRGAHMQLKEKEKMIQLSSLERTINKIQVQKDDFLRRSVNFFFSFAYRGGLQSPDLINCSS